MRWLILSIMAMTILSLVGLGFIAYNFDPFQATLSIKILFLAVVFLAITGMGTGAFYYGDVIRHKQFANVFFARALRRGILLGFLVVCIMILERAGLLDPRWLVGAIAIVGMIELIAMKAFKPL